MLDEHHNDVESAEERIERTVVAEGMGDNTFAELRAELIRDFGSCFKSGAPSVVEELLDTLADKGVLNLRSRSVTGDERMAQMFTIFQNISSYTWHHPSWPDGFAARYVQDQPWLDDIIEYMTPTEFAEKMLSKEEHVEFVRRLSVYQSAGLIIHKTNKNGKPYVEVSNAIENPILRKVTKQRVTDAVIRAQRYFNRPPRKGQRTKESRNNMRDARIKRLTS